MSQSMMQILIFGGMIAVMYFLIIRPNSKRQKEFRNFQDALQVGDKIVTASGIHGEIIEFKDTTAVIRIAPKVEITIDKLAIRTFAQK